MTEGREARHGGGGAKALPAPAFAAPPRLGDRAQGRGNNWTAIRLAAAFGVMVAHAWPIALGDGEGAPLPPLYAAAGYTLGELCVHVFFVASGFLIAQSWTRSTPLGFAVKRAARIWPGLIAALVFAACLLGPVLTDAEPLRYARKALEYVLRGIAVFPTSYKLPGVFEDSPYPVIVNGSLWTLGYELKLYAVIAALGLLGALTRGGRMAAGLGVFALLALTGVLPAHENLFELMLPGLIGAAAFVWRAHLPLTAAPLLPLLIGAVLTRIWEAPQGLYLLFLDGFIALGAFLLAWRLPPLAAGLERVGDLSYGVYIYSFPVQQTVAHLGGPMSPLDNLALATPPVLALAYLSWRLVERPALRRAHRFARPRKGPDA